jgi:hypothetical protein
VIPSAWTGAQTPPEHQNPETHPASLVQPLAQAVPPHTPGVHDCCCGAGQLPAPSQAAASVATPPAQVGALQPVPSGYAHAVRLAPSQAPPQAEPSDVHWARPFTGAPTTAEQVPP